MGAPLTLDAAGETRFGSLTTDLRTAAGVLRAQAARRGMVLAEASDVELAAAVIAADGWMAITSATGLNRAARYGRAASSVYLAVLLRAAGCGPEAAVEVDTVDPSDWAIAVADGYRRWASGFLGPRTPRALRLAAGDLATGGPSSAFAGLAGVLLVAAEMAETVETPEDPHTAVR